MLIIKVAQRNAISPGCEVTRWSAVSYLSFGAHLAIARALSTSFDKKLKLQHSTQSIIVCVPLVKLIICTRPCSRETTGTPISRPQFQDTAIVSGTLEIPGTPKMVQETAYLVRFQHVPKMVQELKHFLLILFPLRQTPSFRSHGRQRPSEPRSTSGPAGRRKGRVASAAPVFRRQFLGVGNPPCEPPLKG